MAWVRDLVPTSVVLWSLSGGESSRQSNASANYCSREAQTDAAQALGPNTVENVRVDANQAFDEQMSRSQLENTAIFDIAQFACYVFGWAAFAWQQEAFAAPCGEQPTFGTQQSSDLFVDI